MLLQSAFRRVVVGDDGALFTTRYHRAGVRGRREVQRRQGESALPQGSVLTGGCLREEK